METRANFALIGALVLASFMAFAGFTLWLGQSQFNRDFDIYEIVFEGPVSLESGASVRFNGISVGEVSRVAIDRQNDRMVRARVRVDSETPVRTDSVADIELAGITGLTFVQIRAGSQTAELLERQPGGPIPIIQSHLDPLAEIFANGAKVLEAANSSLEGISAVLSEDNVGAFSRTLSNIETVTANLSGEVDLSQDISSTLASVRRASDDFAEASRTFTELGQNANAQIEGLTQNTSVLITDLGQTLERIDKLIETTDKTVADADKIIEPTVGALEEFRLASQDLRLLIQRLDGVARELEQNPQVIITGDPKPYEGGRRR